MWCGRLKWDLYVLEVDRDEFGAGLDCPGGAADEALLVQTGAGARVGAALEVGLWCDGVQSNSGSACGCVVCRWRLNGKQERTWVGGWVGGWVKEFAGWRGMEAMLTAASVIAMFTMSAAGTRHIARCHVPCLKRHVVTRPCKHTNAHSHDVNDPECARAQPPARANPRYPAWFWGLKGTGYGGHRGHGERGGVRVDDEGGRTGP